MRPLVLVLVLVIAATLSSPSLSPAATQEGYFRFPALHGDTLVFTAEGDLWSVPLSGGFARRLTSHPGMENHAAISPDGTIIAFSAQYEGPTEVYTMPSDGGLPTRRTYDGEADLVVGWTPGGKILYTSRHYSTLPNTQLFVMDPATGTSTQVALSQGSDGCYDATGTTLYFTRLPFQGSHTKRYKGGTAQNIWKWAPADSEAIPLTGDYPGTSKNPMWWQGRIYFISDRDGIMNLWSMDENGKNHRQLTYHRVWDVRTASLDRGRIAYQVGADIHVVDVATGADTLVPIRLVSDFDQTREHWVKKPMDYLTSLALSPDGDRVTLTARGMVFVAPVQPGRFLEATHKEGVRYRDAKFFPDGKSLLSLSTETGELEFWRIPANGVGEPTQLTHDGTVYRYESAISPDGKSIAFTDKNQRLWIYDIDRKTDTKIAESAIDRQTDLHWSPDSKWLAYVESADNLYSQIKLYHRTDGVTTTVTDERVDSYDPVWSPDGKWVYFLSDRTFESAVGGPWGPRQPEPYYDNTTKVYALSLLRNGRFPFDPPDELEPPSTAGKEKSKEEKKDTARSKTPDVKIDLEGIQERVHEVPVPAGDMNSLAISEKALYYIDHDPANRKKRNLLVVEIKNKEVKPVALVEDIKGYDLSADRKKIVIAKGDGVYVIDAGTSAVTDLAKHAVDLSAWKLSVNPREEWRQMFVEAWRLERDFFYDPHLHDVDWKAVLDRHLALLDRVTDRDELNDLLSSMVGELSALHTFVVGGDVRKGEDQISPATLGARLVRNEDLGGFRIEHIYRAEPDYPDALSPLARPGVHANDGDVILSVNGVPALSVPSLGELLRNQAGQQVLLKIRSGSDGKETETIVKPITPQQEYTLRYSEWEYTRREMVEKEGKGKIGYVHLRAMGAGNFAEWVKNYYPIFQRDGLIVDVRDNTGGNIDSWVLEKLLRKVWFYWKPRVGRPYWNMQYAFRGHMVVLCNQRTASDGEAFTEGFRRLGLGKVIGMRTWGGEVWLSFDTWLVDKGIASAAETGVYSPQGQWLIEGHGVDPDMVVDDAPHATYEGRDAQLDAAIRYLQEQIELHPVVNPPTPPYPDKAFPERKK
jgi:tricorn protease